MLHVKAHCKGQMSSCQVISVVFMLGKESLLAYHPRLFHRTHCQMVLPSVYQSFSSYLVRPRISSQRRQWHANIQVFLRTFIASHPQPTRTTLISYALWASVCVVMQYSVETMALHQQSHQADAATITPLSPVTQLVNAPQLSSLTGGPSGRILPPGSPIPANTYLNSYIRGQCTWYAASRRQVPPGWGNAVSWYYNALANNWQTGSTPAIGAIAWTAAGPYGHVAIVEGISADRHRVYLSEMNFNGVKSVTYRWASSTGFRYIY